MYLSIVCMIEIEQLESRNKYRGYGDMDVVFNATFNNIS